MVCYLNVPCPAVPSIACLALQPMISILSSFPLPDLRIYAKICEVLCIQITNFHIPCLWEIMLIIIKLSGKEITGRTLHSAEGILCNKSRSIYVLVVIVS